MKYWIPKIENNIERDARKIDELERSGWHVIVIWQCEINTIVKRENKLPELMDKIKNNLDHL